MPRSGRLPLYLPAVATALALAAPAARASDAQLWTGMSVTAPIGKTWEASVDGNMRFYDNATDYRRLQLRGMLGARLAPGVLLGAGYSYVGVEGANGRTLHEHRLFQQLSLPVASIGKTTITARNRLEQRWFEGRDGTLWRFRSQVRANIPLDGPKGLRATFYAEPFILLNRPSGTRVPTGLNELRSFAGLGIPLTDQVTLEAGYLNQQLFPGEGRMNHVLNMNLSVRL